MEILKALKIRPPRASRTMNSLPIFRDNDLYLEFNILRLILRLQNWTSSFKSFSRKIKLQLLIFQNNGPLEARPPAAAKWLIFVVFGDQKFSTAAYTNNVKSSFLALFLSGGEYFPFRLIFHTFLKFLRPIRKITRLILFKIDHIPPTSWLHILSF